MMHSFRSLETALVLTAALCATATAARGQASAPDGQVIVDPMQAQGENLICLSNYWRKSAK